MMNFLKDLLKNLIFAPEQCFFAFFLATARVFFEMSIPSPFDFFNSLSRLISMQPLPVPISKILIFLF